MTFPTNEPRTQSHESNRDMMPFGSKWTRTCPVGVDKPVTTNSGIRDSGVGRFARTLTGHTQETRKQKDLLRKRIFFLRDSCGKFPAGRFEVTDVQSVKKTHPNVFHSASLTTSTAGPNTVQHHRCSSIGHGEWRDRITLLLTAIHQEPEGRIRWGLLDVMEVDATFPASRCVRQRQ